MNSIYLIEDHNKALDIWRQRRAKGIDLVHLDAHIDFDFHLAGPVKKVVSEAKSIKDLKQKLEYSLSFLHYEKDFDKQTNIGNYIHPAINEDIVKNFYWVVPGSLKEFKDSEKIIRNILTGISKRYNKEAILDYNQGIISIHCSGRNFGVCCLDNMPTFTQDSLLDIDTDFFIIDSIKNSDNIKNIGKRRPWILPSDLARILKEKVKRPEIITIAYSVNGGWTPIKYKFFADELAYYFRPIKFKRRIHRNCAAAKYFDFFQKTGRKEYYWKAIRLNPTYRHADNNYGPLYLAMRRFALARKEFMKILRVDKNNPAALSGLGQIALGEKEFLKAKRYFYSTLQSLNNSKLFSKTRKECLSGLGKAEFYLKNFKKAKKLLLSYRNISRLEPESYYTLGCIYEREKRFSKAASLYRDAIRLGIGRIEPLYKLLRISRYLKDKDSVIGYIIAKHRDFKRELKRLETLSKRKKGIRGLVGMKKNLLSLEKRLTNSLN